MEKNKKKLFTTGELASLCNIHRKTLLFYDRLGLIKPEFIDDNGYRYYARRQFFTLEIILALRKLDISLPEIGEYLNNKSTSNYKNLLAKHANILDQLLLNLQKMRSELNDRINFLENTESLPVESVHLTAEAEEYLFLSDPVPQNADLKIRTKISAQHLSTLADYVTFNNHVSGYILDKTAFIAGKRPHTKYFYQSFSQPFDSPYFFLKSAGSYATIYFEGIYCSYGKPHVTMLYQYLQDNNLQAVSDLYMTSIRNHWVTNDNGSYLNKLSVKVKKITVEF